MKKPRKPKPKAKPRRREPAAAPRRTSLPPSPPRARRAARPRRSGLRDARRRLSALAATGTASARRGLTDLAGLARRLASDPPGRGLLRGRAGPRVLALPYGRDEREALLLLFLPFLLMASAIVAHQSARTLYAYVNLAAVESPELEAAAVHPGAAKSGLPLAALPRTTARPAHPETAAPTPVAHAPAIPSLSAPGAPLPAAPRDTPTEATAVPAPSAGPSEPAPAVLALTPPPAPAPSPAPVTTRTETTLALLSPAEEARRSASPVAPHAIDSYEADADGNPLLPGLCAVEEAPRGLETAALPAAAPMSLAPEAFGLRLAEAAEAQASTSGFVIYNDAYRRISYPMGDVHHMFGVCTDVIVRAYRAVGIDLQTLVHQARAGSGDRNIDHRRTEVLRRFFAAHGESLPVSPYAEDYRPGDIVTYHRPQNTRSRSHIAVVSSKVAPSGRPMIVHNRGWGPQLEDALFVDRITGHYRYRGPAAPRDTAGREAPDTARAELVSLSPAAAAN